MIYNIIPVPKPRMTRADKWKQRPCVKRYWEFKDRVRTLKMDYSNGQAITFYMPMPTSWSKKKRNQMNGKPHTQKPDIDNMVKALFDALYDDDSSIWHIGEVKKIWAEMPAIEII